MGKRDCKRKRADDIKVCIPEFLFVCTLEEAGSGREQRSLSLFASCFICHSTQCSSSILSEDLTNNFILVMKFITKVRKAKMIVVACRAANLCRKAKVFPHQVVSSLPF